MTQPILFDAFAHAGSVEAEEFAVFGDILPLPATAGAALATGSGLGLRSGGFWLASVGGGLLIEEFTPMPGETGPGETGPGETGPGEAGPGEAGGDAAAAALDHAVIHPVGPEPITLADGTHVSFQRVGAPIGG